MATYPSSVVSFTTKVNNSTIVDAADPNTIQAEVIAIETAVGANPATGTNTYTSSGYSSGTSHANLTSRLTNMEVGIIGDVHTQYVKIAGGSTITSSSSSVKGLVVKGAASQTANLQEWQNSSSTVLAYISPAGALVDTKVAPDLNNLYVLAYVFG